MLQPAPALILAGVAIQDPGNAGAVIRAAAAAGATGVIVDEASANPWGWKALRASMGSDISRAGDPSAARSRRPWTAWRAAGVSIVAAVPRGGHADVRRRPDASRSPSCSAAKARDCRAELCRQPTRQISIPMTDAVESLNVAVAAALLLYEARRQRR